MDILILTESWFGQHGNEETSSDVPPVGHCPLFSTPVPWCWHTAVVYSDTLAECLTSTLFITFQHPSFEAARISPTSSSSQPFALCRPCVYTPPVSGKNSLQASFFKEKTNARKEGFLANFLIWWNFAIISPASA